MGLLSSIGRRVGAFGRGAGDSVDARLGGQGVGHPRRIDAGIPAISSLLGGIAGAGANPDDPMGGAMSGAALGGLGGAGFQGARMGAGALVGGIKALLQQMPFEGAGFEAAKQQIAQKIAQETGGSRPVQNLIGRARNAEELEQILSAVITPEGEVGGYAQQFGNRF